MFCFLLIYMNDICSHILPPQGGVTGAKVYLFLHTTGHWCAKSVFSGRVLTTLELVFAQNKIYVQQKKEILRHCNVKKITCAIMLLPLQGAPVRLPLPRAMPWAMCLLPLRGALCTIIAQVIFYTLLSRFDCRMAFVFCFRIFPTSFFFWAAVRT